MTEYRKCQDRPLLVLGLDRGFLVAIEFFPGSVSRQEFHVATWFLDFKP